MATTIRSSNQLYIDENLNLNSKKVENLADGSANSDGVNFGQMNTAIGNATSGFGNSLHIPVADLAACKAVIAAERADKMLINVESLGLYRFDLESVAVSNDDTVIRPTDVASDAAAGRWIKMSSSITDHNNLSGKQGGTTNEYYHLTAAQLSALTHTGEVTSDANGALTITDKAVTLAKMADVATAIFLGRTTAGPGVPEAMTVAQAKALLGLTGLNLAQRKYRVTPAGTINGSNVVFTIADNVISGTEEIFRNGILQTATVDYTITYGATTTITFTVAPSNVSYSDLIVVNYSI